VKLRRSTRWLAPIAALSVALASLPTPALAQPPPDPSGQSAAVLAEALFDAAVKLMQDQKFAEACPKLAESHRLDPASGTVFNLAICLEKEGKHASAAIAFEESIARSLKDGNKERENLARDRLAQLKPLVSRVVVKVAPKIGALEGLDVRFDGASVRQQAWGLEVPMDPGVHVLTAVAQGKRELRREVDVNESGKVFEVVVDELVDAPAPPPVEREPGRKSDGEGGGKRLVGFGLLGLGGLLVIGGSVSGIVAIDRHAESDRLCGPPGCTSDGAAAEVSANRYAWGANIGIGLGLVSAAVGTYLVLTGKPAGRAAALPFPLAF
jgi:serine/threonine-protein kinase